MNRQAVNPYLPSWEYIPDALANSFAVTRAVSVPKWVKTTYAVDAVVAIILVAWEICAIRKYRKAKKEDEDTEQ